MYTFSTFSMLQDVALENGFITDEDVEMLKIPQAYQ